MTPREWRKDAGLSQDYVSAKLRISQAYLSKIELGRRHPTPALAARIVRLSKEKVTLAETGVRE